ncbi:MAG TPA: hydroxyphenylacetyl-CoA thioesterase PaaI [Steroidobacteraceae bacterium]|nr:hydroxyphenylacetyl-CoA thioesterase PaaI [Steroidobacteraceae bacterium]
MDTGGEKTSAPTAQRTAERAVRVLYEQDRASQSLGMRITRVAPGEAEMTMQVRTDMTNGHDICHGGFVFALADSTFAFACNSHGDSTVAAAASIDFLAPVRAGDTLTATARELWRGGRSGLYEIVVANQRGESVALFRGRSQRVRGRLVPEDWTGGSI